MWNALVLDRMNFARRSGDWTAFYYWQNMFEG